jgi:GAF domain-containing protein
MPNTLNLSTVNSVLTKIALLRDLEPDQLLNQVVEIVHAHIDIYFLEFFLLNSEDEWAIFRAGTRGEVTDLILSKGYRIRVGTNGLIADKIELRNEHLSVYLLPSDPQNNLDIQLELGQTPYYFSPLLPETKAELLLPLRFQGKLLGTWHINSSRFNGFELDDIIYFQLLADQIAVRLNVQSAYET